MKKVLAALLLLSLSAIAANAQSSATVVTACGTLGQNYTPGAVRPLTQTITGELCSAASSGGATQQVEGNVASGTPDSGNPVKVGGIYNVTKPTFANLQRGDFQIGTRGSLHTTVCSIDSTNCAAAALSADDLAVSTGIVATSFNSLFDGTNWDRARSVSGGSAIGTGTAAVHTVPTSAATVAIVPVVTAAAADSLVLKASAGNLYSVYATNQTVTAGFLVVVNAISEPADGAIAPLDCVPLPASGNASINYTVPARYGTGLTAVVSSGADCFTKTTGVITAFIKGAIQ